MNSTGGLSRTASFNALDRQLTEQEGEVMGSLAVIRLHPPAMAVIRVSCCVSSSRAFTSSRRHLDSGSDLNSCCQPAAARRRFPGGHSPSSGCLSGCSCLAVTHLRSLLVGEQREEM